MTEQRSAVLLFTLGALLCAGALASPLLGGRAIDDRMMAFTFLFGMPYALRELARTPDWLVITYLVLLVPAAYLAAWTAAMFAWSAVSDDIFADAPGAWLVAGLAGGLAGSCLSFAALLWRPLRADGAPRWTMAAGIALLTALGGVGLWVARSSEAWKLALFLFLPWQITFGYFLSRLLKPSQPRGA